MGEWAAALPAVGLALAVLLVPGLAAGYAAGLRGIPAWGLAPPISVSVVAVAAAAAGAAGVPWGLAPAAATALAVAAAAGVWRRLAGRPASPDPGRFRVLPAALTVVAGGLAAVAVALGIGWPGRFPQTFDAVFHLNAVARAAETGNASSLALGTLTNPERSSAFYPGAWHAITALVGSSGVEVAVAAEGLPRQEEASQRPDRPARHPGRLRRAGGGTLPAAVLRDPLAERPRDPVAAGRPGHWRRRRGRGRGRRPGAPSRVRGVAGSPSGARAGPSHRRRRRRRVCRGAGRRVAARVG